MLEACYRARRAGHAARLRHRQLRPGDAARRRRRPEPRRDERGEIDRARPRRRRGRRRSSPRSTGETRQSGQEIRLHPSTYNTASIGGFIAGGSGGVGSINWGGLRDLGNVLRPPRRHHGGEAARARTDRAATCMKVMHAYGTNGIITEVELPLDAAYDWVDVIVGFDDYMQRGALRRTARQPGRAALQGDRDRRRAGPVRLFPAPPEIPAREQSVVLLMVAPHAIDAVPRARGARAGGDPLPLRHRDRSGEEGPAAGLRADLEPHDACAALRVDPTITYLQVLYPFPTHVESVRADDRDLRRRGAGASRIRHASTARSAAPACRSSASPPRSGSTRSCASTRTMAARSSTRTATRWRKAA